MSTTDLTPNEPEKEDTAVELTEDEQRQFKALMFRSYDTPLPYDNGDVATDKGMAFGRFIRGVFATVSEEKLLTGALVTQAIMAYVHSQRDGAF